ncbi:Calnexin [Trichinella pseudospiralis]|uniref:Calnexin n=1 Tax=Trichinella pseudospiralis TaxID=6337 RepID=A0A0V1DW95_TRIPS|nr:Calnexin [Trichinella pseudospiralis]
MQAFIMKSIFLMVVFLCSISLLHGSESESSKSEKVVTVSYETPASPPGAYFADPFKHTNTIGKKWILSMAKKEGVDEDIARYDGEWAIGEWNEPLLKYDYGLIVKKKARHHAISSKLDRIFHFSSKKPLIVQYDVKFQEGQECGGAYIKLLTHLPTLKLTEFVDKTPYVIMFGPDKCGLNAKMHFIIRYKNPFSEEYAEHTAPQSTQPIESYFTDRKTHLYTLVLNPDDSYIIYVDQKEIVRGNLKTSLEPSIIPPEEIDDPNDRKPEDWDEREEIPDSKAVKPDDWDENAPEYIEDDNAEKPAGWLDDESEYIPDDKAEKPSDWDEEVDGTYEAPLIKNPKCASAPGCGEWKRPTKRNPAYKGKWLPPMIKNPAYKAYLCYGKWKPRQIPNPDYFDVENIFSTMEPVAAIGIELWTMSDGIFFDNFLITDKKEIADNFASKTWAAKASVEGSSSSKLSVLESLVEAANARPWLWAVYFVMTLIPVVLVCIYCFGSSKKDVGMKKKFDVPVSDDEGSEEGDNDVKYDAKQNFQNAEDAGEFSKEERSDSDNDSDDHSPVRIEKNDQNERSPRRRVRREN